MRLIKFNAWNRKTKTMLRVLELCFAHIKDEFGDIFDLKDCELLQFTGLKDKNEKEIFEKDIIAFTVFDYNGADTQWMGIVTFSNGQWQLWNKQNDEFYGADGAYDLCWVFQQDEEIEKIGNIYENESLLK